jgi:hypothetical protein
LKSVTLHSDTVLFCMREAVAGALAQSVLVQLPLDYSSETTLTCNIIHPARRTLSPAATKVVELIEELMAGGNEL